MMTKNSANSSGAENNLPNNIIPKIPDIKKIRTIFPDGKIVKLVGYSDLNNDHDELTRYKKAKAPVEKGFNDLTQPGLTEAEIDNWLGQNGWTELAIPAGNDGKTGEVICNVKLSMNINTKDAIKTIISDIRLDQHDNTQEKEWLFNRKQDQEFIHF